MERKLSEQELVRREKLKSVERPYPDKYETTHTISEARLLPDGTKNVSIAGRIGFMRKMGKLAFVKIRNIEDAIQLQFRADVLGEEKYEEMKKIFDSGDFIGAKGEIITNVLTFSRVFEVIVLFISEYCAPISLHISL